MKIDTSCPGKASGLRADLYVWENKWIYIADTVFQMFHSFPFKNKFYQGNVIQSVMFFLILVEMLYCC